MSTLPYRCRWVGCEDQQVEGSLCVQHARLAYHSDHDIDHEPAEDQ